MSRPRSSPVSRRLLAWIAATTLLPLTGLVWLGRTIVEHDRRTALTAAEERREQTLGVATAALQRTVAEVEERLTALASAPGASPASLSAFGADSGAAVAIFDRHGLAARTGTLLPYYPAVASTEIPPTVFAKAEQQEFGETNSARAIAYLEPLAHASDVGVRAEALLRLARIYRKAGDNSRALNAYDALESLGEARIGDRAAAFAARQGRGLLFEAAGRISDLRSEATRLGSDLAAGRWVLTRPQYEFSRQQVLQWSGHADVAGMDEDRLALADATEMAWRNWVTSSPAHQVERQRRTFKTAHGPTLISTRASADRLVVLVTGTRFLEIEWLAELRELKAGTNVDLALTDGDGQAVIGRPDAPAARQTVRTASLTSLPWTVHAISTDAPNPGLSRSTQLVLATAAFGALMLVAGACVIGRAIARELSVAALQSDFVAAVSHEFRTPLTTIRQLSELLTRGRVSSADRRQQFYETLLRESNRLHHLVEELLDFGRMEARALEFQFTEIDPEAFVRQIVTDFGREVASSGFTVDLNVKTPLPHIRADQGMLSRVVWNLLDNAVKYSPVHRSVQVVLERRKDLVLVQVRDQGIGIPLREQASIFGKFVRGAAAKMASIRGTGLGLAMAKQIVEAHGGWITVESAEGVGSTFTVLLPIAETS